jgi:hypothetical protein
MELTFARTPIAIAGLAGFLRTSKALHLMARVDEFADNGRTEKPLAPVPKTLILVSLAWLNQEARSASARGAESVSRACGSLPML